jgi:hypothetical protein
MEAVEIYPGGSSKNSRILTMFKAFKAGEIFIAPETRSAVITEILQFNPLKRDNTDNILDLLTYAPKVLVEFAEFIVATNILTRQDEGNIPVLEDWETSPF